MLGDTPRTVFCFQEFLTKFHAQCLSECSTLDKVCVCTDKCSCLNITEVQLKPDHVPFKLVCYWEELLEKYTDAEEVDRERGAQNMHTFNSRNRYSAVEILFIICMFL